MKLVTPKHILREYERLMRAAYQSPCIKTEPIGENVFVQKACESLKKTYTPREAMQLLQEMVGYLEGVHLTPNLFYEASVQKDLTTALKKHPARAEAKEILEFIEEAAQFKWSWSQSDSESEVRRFRRASKHEWEELCQNKDAEIFKKNGNIRVLYLEVEPKTTKIAEKAKKELGYELFWSRYYRHWQIWFNLRREGHYYFYWD